MSGARPHRGSDPIDQGMGPAWSTDTHGQSMTALVHSLTARSHGSGAYGLAPAPHGDCRQGEGTGGWAGTVATAANLALLAGAATTATVVLDMAQILPSWASALAIAFALALLIAAIGLASRGRLAPGEALVPSATEDQPGEDVKA